MKAVSVRKVTGRLLRIVTMTVKTTSQQLMSAVTTGPRSLLKVSKGFTKLESLLIVKTVVGYLPQNISVKP